MYAICPLIHRIHLSYLQYPFIFSSHQLIHRPDPPPIHSLIHSLTICRIIPHEVQLRSYRLQLLQQQATDYLREDLYSKDTGGEGPLILYDARHVHELAILIRSEDSNHASMFLTYSCEDRIPDWSMGYVLLVSS